MKKLIILLLLGVFMSCQNTSKKQELKEDQSTVEPTGEMSITNYPEDFTKVLETHGGINLWKKQKTLKFTISKQDETEQHIVDLKDRMDKTVTTDYEMGYNGEKAWIMNKKGEYKGNAAFMHNLMFYFYAMPFALADKGVNYEKIDNKIIKGKNYQGFKATFDSGIGASSSDEYFLYYDPATYQMAWLGYKASFGTDKKPEWPNYIGYDKWARVDGVLLPTSIAWYTVEDGEVKEVKNRVDFTNISLSKEAEPEGSYSIPDNAVVVDDKKSM